MSRNFFQFWFYINLLSVHVMSHTKSGPVWFSCFDFYQIQTNKQKNKQAKYIYRLCINEIQPILVVLPLCIYFIYFEQRDTSHQLSWVAADCSCSPWKKPGLIIMYCTSGKSSLSCSWLLLYSLGKLPSMLKSREWGTVF